MKIRHGFVSNSSSSSFVIGIAVVTDASKLAKILKKHNDLWEIEVKICRGDYDLKVTSFDDTEETLSWDQAELGDLILRISNFADEGDNHFWDDSCGGYMDYDIEFDDCDYSIVKLIQTLEETKCVKHLTYSYGAGRNG